MLDHEIELYDTTNDKLVAWVRIPTLDYNDDTVIYLHYGNPNVTVSTENPAGVWDDNFVGVYHLSHTSGDAVDSIGNFTAEERISIRIPTWIKPALPPARIILTAATTWAPIPNGRLTGAHTYCAWVKFSTTGSNMVILEDGDSTDGDGLGMTSAGNFRYGAYWSSDRNIRLTAPAPMLTDNGITCAA